MTGIPSKPDRQRDGKGRFRPGHTGNAAGRPPRPFDHARLSAASRDFILAAANRPAVLRKDLGQDETISFFEAKVLELATGKASNRRECTGFIKMVILAAGSKLPQPLRPPRPDRAVSDDVYRRGNEAEIQELEASHAEWNALELADMSDEQLEVAARRIGRMRGL